MRVFRLFVVEVDDQVDDEDQHEDRKQQKEDALTHVKGYKFTLTQ